MARVMARILGPNFYIGKGFRVPFGVGIQVLKSVFIEYRTNCPVVNITLLPTLFSPYV
jgi:hypothetical protein